MRGILDNRIWRFSTMYQQEEVECATEVLILRWSIEPAVKSCVWSSYYVVRPCLDAAHIVQTAMTFISDSLITAAYVRRSFLVLCPFEHRWDEWTSSVKKPAKIRC